MHSNDPHHYPYSSRRTLSYAKNGMVATTQSQAAQAGLQILQQGGNAVDAAVATAAALSVVEPTSNGIGGDAFALVWIKDKLHGLNASGPAPAALDIATLDALGFDEIPLRGWLPVTVPGCPSAWATLNERFGALPLAHVMAPAITLAEQGFVVSPTIAAQWQKAMTKIASLSDDVFDHWHENFAPGGEAPRAGQVFTNVQQAQTLREIAETQGESFYRGALAERIADFSARSGGYLSLEDLATYRAQWVDPISTNYKGYDVWEIPPNGQGLIALSALNIIEQFPLAGRDDIDTLHRQIEAMKLAYSDGRAYIADPATMTESVQGLLSKSYACERAALIGERARLPSPGKPKRSGTVYLAAADNQGNMVSFIQSNYHDFGSAVVVPGTGICLQNRGRSFSLKSGQANALAPGKKPLHTIIPGFISKQGQALGAFGVMGGYMQPQGHMQVVMNMLDFGLNPQAALDAPRWQWLEGNSISLEQGIANATAQALSAKGHQITIDFDPTDFGRGQIILRDPHSGVLSGGTEARADGYIAAY
ncbi:MAG: gamma-glutamyltransferase family protein [Pseudomonadales bacterium]